MERDEYKKHLELHAREAEQCLVAALFGEQGAEVFSQLTLTGLTADDFFVPAYRAAYRAAAELNGRGEYPDRGVLASYIKSTPAVTEPMRAEIAQAVAAPYSIANVGSYANAVVEKGRARELASGLHRLLDRTAQVGGELSSDELVREMDAVSLSLGQRSSDNGLLRSPDEHLREVVDRMDAQQNGLASGVLTGIDELDERLGGLQGGELIVVAGRPAMGKSVLGFGIGTHHGLKSVPGLDWAHTDTSQDAPEMPLIAGFSCEMPAWQLTMRQLADVAGVPFGNLRKSALTDEDWQRLTRVFPACGKSDIRIDDDPHLTPAIVRAKVRALERQTGKKVSLVIIDYLQLMSGDERHQNRASEIAEITRKLKLLAKELDAPVVLLSQLNRSVEQRTDKRPVMADLRESGSIEQDADVIIFIYRDEYYNPDSPARGMAEIIVGKVRNGATGTVITQFSGEFQRFSNRRADFGYESSYPN